MASPDDNALAAQALAAELNAALAARHASLEYERRFLSLDHRDDTARDFFEVRVALARAKDATKRALEHLDVLGPLALGAAASLEESAQALYPYLAKDVEMKPLACLRVVRGLQRLARIDEARTRAVFTAAREGLRLPGFEDAVDLAVESEQLFLALRRFEALLERGGDWESHDIDWLLLHATSVPGRMRLRAAALRSLVLELSGGSLGAEQAEALKPYQALQIPQRGALQWLAAGFSPEECVDWRATGLKDPIQAHAWHCHGFGPQEALAWSKADLLPDESGIFVHCGAGEMGQALALRRALGDIEHFFPWYRAGFKAAETLQWLEQGVRSPEQAMEKRKFTALAAAAAAAQADLVKARPAPLPGLEAAAAEASAPVAVPDAVPKAAPAPAAPAVAPLPSGPSIFRGPPVAKELSTPQRRAKDLLGVDCADDAAAFAARPAEGGAWIGWGVLDEQALAAQADGTQSAYSLPWGPGLFDLVLASEGAALPGGSLKPASFEPDPAWQERLDRLRAMRKAAPAPGAWHLSAWAPCGALLLWGLVWKGPEAPWAEAVDFNPAEPWRKRWDRKTEEWGEEGAKPSCVAGQVPGGAWYVGFAESLVRCGQERPLAFKAPWPAAAWREAFEDFCLKMEIHLQPAHWHLVAEKATA